jgi:hypothetical protein
MNTLSEISYFGWHTEGHIPFYYIDAEGVHHRMQFDLNPKSETFMKILWLNSGIHKRNELVSDELIIKIYPIMLKEYFMYIDLMDEHIWLRENPILLCEKIKEYETKKEEAVEELCREIFYKGNNDEMIAKLNGFSSFEEGKPFLFTPPDVPMPTSEIIFDPQNGKPAYLILIGK